MNKPATITKIHVVAVEKPATISLSDSGERVKSSWYDALQHVGRYAREPEEMFHSLLREMTLRMLLSVRVSFLERNAYEH